MQHRQGSEGGSILVYTYTFEAGPRGLRWLVEPLVAWVFDQQTRRRFARLRRFLDRHASEVEAWQARSEPQ